MPIGVVLVLRSSIETWIAPVFIRKCVRKGLNYDVEGHALCLETDWLRVC